MRHLTLGFGSKRSLLWQKQERNGPEPEKVPQSHGKGGMDLDGLGIPKENSLLRILSLHYDTGVPEPTLFDLQLLQGLKLAHIYGSGFRFPKSEELWAEVISCGQEVAAFSVLTLLKSCSVPKLWSQTTWLQYGLQCCISQTPSPGLTG